MNTNISISLDKRRSKKDGTFPVIMRLGHNERTTSIPLDISVSEKDWDDKNKQVKKSYVGLSSVTRLNNLIQKKKADAMDKILKLSELGELNTLSVSSLRDKLTQEDKRQSFIKYGESLVKDLKEANRIGTARSYNDVISVLSRYKGKDISFTEINYSFLTKFETHHMSKGNGINGLAVYMRTIRAIFNKAIKDGIIEKEIYPFDNYKIKTAPTEKRALEANLLSNIVNLTLEQKDPCFHARNFFVASYMMYGMNFTDMAFLKKDDINNGRINYRRKKTSKLYDIKVTKNLETILGYYMQNKTEFVFPIIKRDTPETQNKDIRWARKRYNNKLNDIAKMCGIDTNLTSYVSRHSFATQAMMQQVPLNAISSMLGHSSLKTTEIYLKSLPSDTIDDYNAKVLGL